MAAWLGRLIAIGICAVGLPGCMTVRSFARLVAQDRVEDAERALRRCPDLSNTPLTEAKYGRWRVWYPIFEAKSRRMYELLVAYGARLDMAEVEGWCPAGVRPDVRARCAWKSEKPLINHVSFHGYGEVLLYLLELGLDPNTVDSVSGSQCLIYSCANGRVEQAALLLRYGADVNHVAWDGKSPLSAAAGTSRKPELVRLLLEHGALVSVDHLAYQQTLEALRTRPYWKEMQEIKDMLDAAMAKQERRQQGTAAPARTNQGE